MRSSQRLATSRCISQCSNSREERFWWSIVTMNFSPGPRGFGSETIWSQPTTPGSELKMKSSGVSSFHSGRRPSASAENTHSSPWRAISATGPWANGPIVWRRYM